MYTVKLGDVCFLEKGKVGIQAAIPGKYPLVTTGEERASHNECHFSGEAVCIPLVSGTGHGHASIKRVHYEKGEFSVGNILVACIPKDYKRTSARFLYLYFSLLKNDVLVPLMQGSANVSLKVKDLYNVEIPDMTLSEQIAIVNKFDSLEQEQRELLNEITSQLSNIQLLRQTILQEAVQGKLVPQDLTDEPASELLKRIKAEKAKQAKKGKTDTYEPITDVPYEIPKGWVWCRLGEVAFYSEAGKSFVCEKRSVEKDEWGVIKVSAISWGSFNEKENKALPSNVQPNLAYRIQDGDFLISRANTDELIGRSVIVKKLTFNLLLSDKSIRFKFAQKIDAEYINLYNNSNLTRAYYKTVASGTSDSMKNITRDQMYMLPVPLPSFNEQKRIVAKVAQFMQLCDELEAQVLQSKTDAEKLLQAVLREAFDGNKKYNTENAALSLAAEP